MVHYRGTQQPAISISERPAVVAIEAPALGGEMHVHAQHVRMDKT